MPRVNINVNDISAQVFVCVCVPIIETEHHIILVPNSTTMHVIVSIYNMRVFMLIAYCAYMRKTFADAASGAMTTTRTHTHAYPHRTNSLQQQRGDATLAILCCRLSMSIHYCVTRACQHIITVFYIDIQYSLLSTHHATVPLSRDYHAHAADDTCAHII